MLELKQLAASAANSRSSVDTNTPENRGIIDTYL